MISLQVGRNYWIGSLYDDFLKKGETALREVLIGIFSGPEENYDSICDKIESVQRAVKKAHEEDGYESFELTRDGSDVNWECRRVED